MRPHSRLLMFMGILTILLIGASMPSDPTLDGTPDWSDRIFVGILCLICFYNIIRAISDMSYKTKPNHKPQVRQHHHVDKRRKKLK